MEINYEEEITNLLEKIDRLITRYSKYFYDESIKMMISDRVNDIKKEIRNKDNLLNQVKKYYQKIKPNSRI